MKAAHGHAIPYHAMFDAAFRADPFPFYDQLRAEAPVVWDDVLRAWVVTRSADIETVFHDAATFSSNRVALGRARFIDPALTPLFDMVGLLMLQMDAPAHDRLRRLTAQAFKRKAVEGYGDQVQQICDQLIDAMPTAGPVDVLRALTIPLPVQVISAIVGVPPEDQDQIKRWCDDFSIVALNFYARITDAQLKAGLDAVAGFSAYLAKRIEQHRGAPGSDLLSALIAAEDQEGGLGFEELVANSFLLLNAGNETTTILLTNAIYMLCTRPEIAAALRADRDLIPAMIEETLRYMPPVHFLGRLVTRETELGGETLRAGDLVLVFMGSAGRDPAHYEAPGDYRLDRGHPGHLSFGSGPHVCLGLQLARLEARVMINALLDRFSDFTLADTELGFGPNLNLRCFDHLPVIFTPA